ncbi:AAA family ATPase [Litoreibacter janthinus]|uniref:Pilus assembly protein CpaE n=1 Tax=Litoreibacter janthinus TaxID=670154 RepID=A0A1I6GCN7_9RHOB|nr:hypothetical protein [Litoreibacter janthinus]SFR39837.1 hypothetical protein SAMN04488002_1234 [Litoreibacter janthinus]
MPFDSASATTTARFAAYVCTDQGAALARSVIEQSGGDISSLHGGGLSGAARLCAETPEAQTLLTEFGNIPIDLACECVTEICRTGANVIVLGQQTDIETYRALRKAGALEFFTFPVRAEDILSVQPTAPAVTIPATPAPVKSPSIAVMGSNGGVGASLFAQNLAFHAAAPKGANLRTALLDADLLFGSQAIDLDRDETPGLFEALKAPNRLDATYIGATMDNLHEQLSLYSHQVRIGQDGQSFEAGLPQIFEPLRAEFSAVVTDLPRRVVMQQPDVISHLDTLVVVIPAGFAGVNAANRLIERIKAQSPDVRILPVLSELRRDAGLSQKDVASTLGHKIIAVLPRSDAAILRAHRAARPLIEAQPRGSYAKATQKIWNAAVAGAPAPRTPARQSLARRIFG